MMVKTAVKTNVLKKKKAAAAVKIALTVLYTYKHLREKHVSWEGTWINKWLIFKEVSYCNRTHWFSAAAPYLCMQHMLSHGALHCIVSTRCRVRSCAQTAWPWCSSSGDTQFKDRGQSIIVLMVPRDYPSAMFFPFRVASLILIYLI